MKALVTLMGITEGSLSEKYKDLTAQRCFGDPEEEVCWHFFFPKERVSC